MKLQNSIVVVTGGAVVIADLNETAGKELATELGERALFSLTDVTDTDSVL